MKISKTTHQKIRERLKKQAEVLKLYEETNPKVTKEEIHRLKKALKDDNPNKLKDWVRGFGMQLDNSIAKKYHTHYTNQLEKDSLFTIKCMETVMIYTLHFNEKCKFGNARIQDFLDDFRVTFELINKGEYKLQDFRDQLKDEKINF